MKSRKKILVIIGTRPEAIKMAPLIRLIKAQSGLFELSVCVTAQHRELMDQELEFFGIKPDFDLDLMTPDQPLWRLTGEAIIELSMILSSVKPDIVLVQGDTTSSFAGALAAFYQKVPVGHIEAGLRTNDIYAPFPEEVYRRLITPMTHFHFAPTNHAAQVLIKEGYDPKSVHMTGNTVIDSLSLGSNLLETRPDLKNQIDTWFQSTIPGANDIINGSSRLILVTAHRRESFGGGLESMFSAIQTLAKKFPKDSFVYPVHPNPNIRNSAQSFLGDIKKVTLTQPVTYPAMIFLMKKAYLFLTDSGGIQEEAPTFGLPVLVMRERTERLEGLELGISRLVGSKTEEIVKHATDLLENQISHQAMKAANNPYGDGHACERILAILKEQL